MYKYNFQQKKIDLSRCLEVPFVVLFTASTASLSKITYKQMKVTNLILYWQMIALQDILKSWIPFSFVLRFTFYKSKPSLYFYVYLDSR